MVMNTKKKIRNLAGFLLVLAAAGWILALSLRPDSGDRHWVVGVLNYSRAPEAALEGLKEGLAQAGFVEGENISFLYSGPIHDRHRLRKEAERLAAVPVDLFFAMTTPATLIARDVSIRSSIPLVFAPVSNAVASGIVPSLRKPGGLATGVSFSRQEVERLHLFCDLIPDRHLFLVPYNPDDPSPARNVARLRPVAEELSVKFVEVNLHNQQEIAAFLARPPDTRIEAIFLPTDSLMVSRAGDFARFSRQYDLPLTTPNQEGVAQGALFSYGMSVRETGRQAARLVRLILTGTPPARLPVEEPEYRISLNLETARKLNLDVPATFLRHAILYPRRP